MAGPEISIKCEWPYLPGREMIHLGRKVPIGASQFTEPREQT